MQAGQHHFHLIHAVTPAAGRSHQHGQVKKRGIERLPAARIKQVIVDDQLSGDGKDTPQLFQNQLDVPLAVRMDQV